MKGSSELVICHRLRPRSECAYRETICRQGARSSGLTIFEILFIILILFIHELYPLKIISGRLIHVSSPQKVRDQDASPPLRWPASKRECVAAMRVKPSFY